MASSPTAITESSLYFEYLLTKINKGRNFDGATLLPTTAFEWYFRNFAKYMLRVHKDWKMILETVEETVHIKYAQNYIFMYVLQ